MPRRSLTARISLISPSVRVKIQICSTSKSRPVGSGMHGWLPDRLRRSLRATLLLHPGAALMVATRLAVTPETLRAAERGLTLLVGAGFPVGRALDTLNALTLFVVAHAASEVTTARVNDAAAAGSQAYVAALDEREFPLLAQAARLPAGTDDGSRFEFAVAAFLRGAAPAAGS
jgi:hypothetical protein